MHQGVDHRHSPLDERCVRHQFEPAVDRCRQCGNPFCGECLVYSFGPKEPPFCVPCALSAAGVRSTAGRAPVVNKREMKRREKERRKAAKRDSERSAPPEIDWSVPDSAVSGLPDLPGVSDGPSEAPISGLPDGLPPIPDDPDDPDEGDEQEPPADEDHGSRKRRWSPLRRH